MLSRFAVLLSVGASLSACERDSAPPKVADPAPVAEMTPAEVSALMARDRSALIVDVNPRGVYDEAHIAGAVWMSSSDVDFDELPDDRSAAIVFYCYNEMCGASHQAASATVERGWTNVARMPAGIVGWKAAGLSVEPPTLAPDIEAAAEAGGCTLDTDDLSQRAAELESLFARALLRRDASATKVTWTFAWSPDVEREIRALTAAEGSCCSFLQFDIARDGDELRWTVTAPPSNAEVLQMLDQLAAAAQRM